MNDIWSEHYLYVCGQNGIANRVRTDDWTAKLVIIAKCVTT